MSGAEQESRHSLETNFYVLKDSLGEQFRKDFPSYTEGLVRETQGGYVTLSEYPKYAEDVYNFQPRSDDVYVSTFPKSGTTWMQEMVWMLVNQCDFEKGKTSLSIRSPFLEINYLLPESLIDLYGRNTIARKTYFPFASKVLEFLDYWKVLDVLRPIAKKVALFMFGRMMRNLSDLERMKGPRVIKTHLPLYLLHPKLLDSSKVVYVARNPKDVIVSYFHYHRLMHFHQYTGDLETFAEYFMSDKVYASPYFPHLLGAWTRRNHPNLHFVFYEDLKKDLRGEIVKVADFLGKPLQGEDQLNKLVEHLRIDKFAKNKAVNYEICKELSFMTTEGRFIRNGKTGDWKNHFSPELNRRIDQWIAKNLVGTDLNFITELEQQD